MFVYLLKLVWVKLISYVSFDKDFGMQFWLPNIIVALTHGHQIEMYN